MFSKFFNQKFSTFYEVALPCSQNLTAESYPVLFKSTASFLYYLFYFNVCIYIQVCQTFHFFIISFISMSASTSSSVRFSIIIRFDC